MNGPEGKNNPTIGAPAILERNLERYPWARLSDDKGDQLGIEVLFDAAGKKDRAWVVTGESGAKLPGPFDADLYVVLCQLLNAAGRPENRTVRVTLQELARLMHRPPSGGWYDTVTTSLRRLAAVTIQAVRTWREGEYIADEKIFHLIDAVDIRHRRDGAKGGTAVMVQISEPVANSIAAGNFRLLDTAAYFALETPTSRRLYRYLDYRRWQGSKRLKSIRFPLKQLAEELPIDRASPSHIKRTLDPAHAHLIERGFLESVEYEERAAPGKKRPTAWVAYRFQELATSSAIQQSEKASGKPLQAPSAEPDYLRERVAKILHLLKDEQSAGFYAKAVKVLPEPVLDGIIGHVRQSLREGMELDVARKVFTRTAQTRAKALGVEL